MASEQKYGISVHLYTINRVGLEMEIDEASNDELTADQQRSVFQLFRDVLRSGGMPNEQELPHYSLKAYLSALQEQNKRQDAQLGAARALLEAFTEAELIGHEGDGGHEQYCVCCGENSFTGSAVKHMADCFWMKARAFLADHPRQP